MKKTGRTSFLSISLLLCYVLFAQGQVPVISTPDTTVTLSSQSFSIPVQTHDFQNLTGLQFLLSWDSNKLKYKRVHTCALDIDEQTNFGTTSASEGLLRFLWFDHQLKPAVLPDGTPLFCIEFEYTGDQNEEVSIFFEEDKRTRIEVYDDTFERLPSAKFRGGAISFAAPDQPAIEPAAVGITCAPNPFSKFTRVDLSMKKTTTALISIIDITGKKIYEERRHLEKGEHSLLLDSRLFPASGTYFCRVQASQITVTQKMIFL